MRALVFALAMGAAGVAHADEPTRNACARASEDAQLLRIKAELVSAREKLVFCSSDACPKVVRKDCSGWLDEVDHAMPTIVLGARDGRGRDRVDVRVTLDGAPLVDRLDGKAIAVDPGDHTLVFVAPGEAPHEEKLVVREGEKNRIVSVTIGAPPPPVVAVRPLAPLAPAPVREGHASSPAAWVVGALGLVTLGAAAAVGVASLVRRQDLYDSCGKAGACDPGDVNQVYTMYDLAYGGAAIGGALLATGVVLFFATRHRLVVSPTVGGVNVVGRF